MLDAYSKMTSDKFKKQLQAVLTTYYEDIRSIQGAIGILKPKFVTSSTEEPDDTSKHNNGPADFCVPLTQKTRQEQQVAAPCWAPVGRKSPRSLHLPLSPRAQPRRPQPRRPQPRQPQPRRPRAAAGSESLSPIKVVCLDRLVICLQAILDWKWFFRVCTQFKAVCTLTSNVCTDMYTVRLLYKL
jgi:hypothetical protein